MEVNPYKRIGSKTRVVKDGHLFVQDDVGLYIDSEDGHLRVAMQGPHAPQAALSPSGDGYDVAVTIEERPSLRLDRLVTEQTQRSHTHVTKREAFWLIAGGWAKIVPRMVKTRDRLKWTEVSLYAGIYTYVAEIKGGCLVMTQDHGPAEGLPVSTSTTFIPGVTLDDIAPEREVEVTGLEED